MDTVTLPNDLFEEADASAEGGTEQTTAEPEAATTGDDKPAEEQPSGDTADKTVEKPTEQPKQDTKPAEAPAPTYVTAEQLQAFQTQVLANIGKMLGAQQQQPPVPAQKPPEAPEGIDAKAYSGARTALETVLAHETGGAIKSVKDLMGALQYATRHAADNEGERVTREQFDRVARELGEENVAAARQRMMDVYFETDATTGEKRKIADWQPHSPQNIPPSVAMLAAKGRIALEQERAEKKKQEEARTIKTNNAKAADGGKPVTTQSRKKEYPPDATWEQMMASWDE